MLQGPVKVMEIGVEVRRLVEKVSIVKKQTTGICSVAKILFM